MTITEAYEPGNGTRYALFLHAPDEDEPLIFAWLNAPFHGRAMRIWGLVDRTYLAEKFGYDNDADLTALLQWLALHGVAVHIG